MSVRHLLGVGLGSTLLAACAVNHRHAPDVAESRPVRVGSILHDDEPVTKVEPTLPSEAAARGVVGPVLVEIRITETGDVSVLSVVRGHSLLDELAKDAVRHWKYRPVVINGTVVPIIKVVAVTFVRMKVSGTTVVGTVGHSTR